MYDRIGLYEKLEPRGIIAPVFHYWDRHEGRLIAAFDHAHLKDDTRFPYVLQCERIKIVEEALKMAKAHPNIDLRLNTEFISFTQDADGVTARVVNPAGEEEIIAGRYHRQRRGRAQHRAQGPRHRVRGLHLRRSYAQYRSRLRFHPARLCPPQLHFGSDRVVEPVSLERAARPLARAFPDRSERRRSRAHAAGGVADADAGLPADRQAVRHRRQQSLRGASARRARNSASAAPSWRAIPRT